MSCVHGYEKVLKSIIERSGGSCGLSMSSSPDELWGWIRGVLEEGAAEQVCIVINSGALNSRNWTGRLRELAQDNDAEISSAAREALKRPTHRQCEYYTDLVQKVIGEKLDLSSQSDLWRAYLWSQIPTPVTREEYSHAIDVWSTTTIKAYAQSHPEWYAGIAQHIEGRQDEFFADLSSRVQDDPLATLQEFRDA